MSFSKKNRFSLKIIFLFLPFKIDNITLDPDPNWAKILDPDPKTKFNVFFIHNTATRSAGSGTGAPSFGQPTSSAMRTLR